MDTKKMRQSLKKLEKFASDEQSLQHLLQIKKENKHQLSEYLKRTQGIELNENSVFDIQIKRLHEYKRQQMNALYVIYKYLEIKSGKLPKTPITVIFGAKSGTGLCDRQRYHSSDPLPAGTDQSGSGSEPVSECGYGRKL